MKKLFVILCIISIAMACKPEDKYPIIPRIQMVSLDKIANEYGYDYKANLTFYFEDGDGDIGLDNTTEDLQPPFDTASIYHYNFFIHYFEKQNGTFVKVDLPAEQNARIPRLSNNTPESIDGDITVEIFINNIVSTYDTVKFEFYIVDRALHHSNIVSTPEIIIDKAK
ncbi:MAG: hypothetical protein RBS29_03535 [Bacteroidales bacterium]|jgi:hypothetical protein|nr:hypothetical protein [Bacteroidales bacterium]